MKVKFNPKKLSAEELTLVLRENLSFESLSIVVNKYINKNKNKTPKGKTAKKSSSSPNQDNHEELEVIFPTNSRFTNAHIFKAMRSMLEVLLDHDEKFQEKVSINAFFSFYRNSYFMTEEDFFKHMKYLTAFPLALYLKNEVEASSLENPWIFKGKMKKYLSRRIVGKSSRTLKLWWSWLQGVKRGCEYASEQLVEEAYLKHARSMQNKPAIHDSEYLSRFTEKVDYLSRNFQHDLEIMQHSTSACYENGFSKGGALTHLVKDYNGHKDVEWKKKGKNMVIKSAIHPLGECRQLLMMFEKEHCKVESIYGYVSYKSFDELFFDIQLQEEIYRPLDCMTYAVREPLKIRMITKGEAKRYALSKCLQKSLWRHIQKFKPFCLTGETLDGSHIYDLIEKTSSLNKKYIKGGKKNLELFVSGDYSAATDNIDAKLSKIVMESFTSQAVRSLWDRDYRVYEQMESERLTIMDKINEKRKLIALELVRHATNVFLELDIPQDILKLASLEFEVEDLEEELELLEQRFVRKKSETSRLEEIYLSVLQPHIVHYPSVDGNPVHPPVVQTNGQLMGSPLSFPILCIINLVSYWLSIETYLGCFVPLKELPVLINGDDILFQSNEEHYEIWKEEVKEVGFKLSIGKNYIHDSVLTINSKLFTVEKTNSTVVVKEVKFFNVGLLMGISKTCSDSKELLVKRLSDNYQQVMEGASQKLRAHTRFLYYNGKRLPQQGVNWFLPINLGGLGFKVYDEVKEYIKVTDYQRCIASYCLKTQTSPSKYLVEGVDRHSRAKKLTRKVTVPLYGPYLEGQEKEPDYSINIMNSELALEEYCYYNGKTRVNVSPLTMMFKTLKKVEVSKYKPYLGDMFVESVYLLQKEKKEEYRWLGKEELRELGKYTEYIEVWYVDSEFSQEGGQLREEENYNAWCNA